MLYSRRAATAAATTDGSKGVVITELAVSVSVCALKRSPFLFSRVNQLLPMTTVELRSSASRSSYTRRVALLPLPSRRRGAAVARRANAATTLRSISRRSGSSSSFWEVEEEED